LYPTDVVVIIIVVVTGCGERTFFCFVVAAWFGGLRSTRRERASDHAIETAAAGTTPLNAPS
jgi:hypothetical protein